MNIGFSRMAMANIANSHLRRIYYSSQVCAQTQVQSLFLYPVNLMEHLCETTEERSGTGSTS